MPGICDSIFLKIANVFGYFIWWMWICCFSHSGTSAITCSYKASSGLMYPLERGFIFVHKPPVHIRFDEVASVNFARGSTTGRTFDFEVDLKNGTNVIFSNLAK